MGHFCWAFLAIPDLLRGPSLSCGVPGVLAQGLLGEGAHSSAAVPKQAGCGCDFSSPEGLWLFSNGQRSKQRLITCQSAENKALPMLS